MWNSRNHTAMAVVGVGLAVAVASPSSAHRLGGAYGYAGGCGAFGAYGYAPAAYGGVYTYGWPYGVIGDVNYPTYGYAAGCGYGTYGYQRPRSLRLRAELRFRRRLRRLRCSRLRAELRFRRCLPGPSQSRLSRLCWGRFELTHR